MNSSSPSEAEIAALEARVSSLTESVLRQVGALLRPFVDAKLGPAKFAAYLDAAVEITRAELTEFLFGQAYADHRDCILRRSLSDEWVVLAIATNAFDKIKARVEGGAS